MTFLAGFCVTFSGKNLVWRRSNIEKSSENSVFVLHSLQIKGIFSTTLWHGRVPAMRRKSNKIILLILYLLNNIYIYSK